MWDGDLVTAAGVSAGIDTALALLGASVDDRTAQAVQLAMEYDPKRRTTRARRATRHPVWPPPGAP